MSDAVTERMSLSVGLVGEGLGAVWTARALARAGFGVDGDQVTQVEVLEQEGRMAWRLDGVEGQRVCGSLYEVVDVLKEGLRA